MVLIGMSAAKVGRVDDGRCQFSVERRRNDGSRSPRSKRSGGARGRLMRQSRVRGQRFVHERCGAKSSGGRGEGRDLRMVRTWRGQGGRIFMDVLTTLFIDRREISDCLTVELTATGLMILIHTHHPITGRRFCQHPSGTPIRYTNNQLTFHRLDQGEWSTPVHGVIVYQI